MHDPMLLGQMALLLAAVGALAGILAGLLGIGGGIILVVAFFYAFQTLGYDSPQLMQICLATSLATIVVTSARSVLSHHKRGAVDWSILRGWAPGIATGALLGVLAASALNSRSLQLLFAVLAIIVALYMVFARNTWRLGTEMPTGMPRGLIAPLIGFLSVLMGIGGGSFGVPLMTLHGVVMQRAVATTAGFGMIIALPSVIGFMFLSVDPATRPPFTVGAVNLPAFALVIVMTTLTAPLGVRMAHALDPVLLRRIFAGFLTLVALNMLRKALLG